MAPKASRTELSHVGNEVVGIICSPRADFNYVILGVWEASSASNLSAQYGDETNSLPALEPFMHESCPRGMGTAQWSERAEEAASQLLTALLVAEFAEVEPGVEDVCGQTGKKS